MSLVSLWQKMTRIQTLVLNTFAIIEWNSNWFRAIHKVRQHFLAGKIKNWVKIDEERYKKQWYGEGGLSINSEKVLTCFKDGPLGRRHCLFKWILHGHLKPPPIWITFEVIYITYFFLVLKYHSRPWANIFDQTFLDAVFFIFMLL